VTEEIKWLVSRVFLNGSANKVDVRVTGAICLNQIWLTIYFVRVVPTFM